MVTGVNNMNSMLIINYIRSRGLSKSEFCKLCDIDEETLENMIYFGKYDNDTLVRVGDIIGVGYYRFFMS